MAVALIGLLGQVALPRTSCADSPRFVQHKAAQPPAPAKGSIGAASKAPAEPSQGAQPAQATQPQETNLCTEHLIMGDPTLAPSWNGWGNGLTNTRFQPRPGKLTFANVHRLKLKWAFGYANVSSSGPQPTVMSGRLFAASENGYVYALNARTGCRYWTYKAKASIPTAIAVGIYKDGTAIFFGDRNANAYAVDAQTGREIWVRKVDPHPSAMISGGLAFFGGRVFVPVQGIRAEEPCCTFRGSVAALDATTGNVVWKTYTVPQSMPRPADIDGEVSYGPAGGGIWAVPTVDAQRRLLYVATSSGSAEPAQPTTSAVLAVDINTGEIKWSRQLTPSDADILAPPMLVKVQDRSVLVVPQQSGIAWALDPAKEGAIVWQYRFAQGGGLGGQWGMAAEDDNVFVGVADLLTPTPGGMRSLALADGRLVWDKGPPSRLCPFGPGCIAGQGGPVTSMPGVVLSGAMDGGIRAYSTKDGAVLWTFDTNQDFDTVNGVKAHGGSMDGAGPVVVDGMLFVNSGTGGLLGRPGNVLLAFGLP